MLDYVEDLETRLDELEKVHDAIELKTVLDPNKPYDENTLNLKTNDAGEIVTRDLDELIKTDYKSRQQAFKELKPALRAVRQQWWDLRILLAKAQWDTSQGADEMLKELEVIMDRAVNKPDLYDLKGFPNFVPQKLPIREAHEVCSLIGTSTCNE